MKSDTYILNTGKESCLITLLQTAKNSCILGNCTSLLFFFFAVRVYWSHATLLSLIIDRQVEGIMYILYVIYLVYTYVVLGDK